MYYENYNRPQQNVYAFVNGLEGAKSYIVPANQTVLLMDSEQPVCYMKSANAIGQGSLRYFKLTEVSESDIKSKQSDYITRDEFKTLVEKIDKLVPKEK